MDLSVEVEKTPAHPIPVKDFHSTTIADFGQSTRILIHLLFLPGVHCGYTIPTIYKKSRENFRQCYLFLSRPLDSGRLVLQSESSCDWLNHFFIVTDVCSVEVRESDTLVSSHSSIPTLNVVVTEIRFCDY